MQYTYVYISIGILWETLISSNGMGYDLYRKIQWYLNIFIIRRISKVMGLGVQLPLKTFFGSVGSTWYLKQGFPVYLQNKCYSFLRLCFV